MFGYQTLRPALFGLEAERAHNLALGGLRALGAIPPICNAWARWHRVEDARLSSRRWGLAFPTPIGLAAGFDKNGDVQRGIFALGFGFSEVGTVTPEGQPGNAKPRMFRHPDHESLQNALGFNNRGARAMRRSFERTRRPGIPIGINIGKNKTTPQERAADDYLSLIESLDTFADYFVVNLSSPNTPGLRDLQSESWIRDLLVECRRRTGRPLLVKLAPDLEPARAVDLALAAVRADASGVILTNTTTDYESIPGVEPVGGLSGRVLKEKSFEILRAVAGALPEDRKIVSVGGIDSGEEVYRRLRAGASLVQIYSALVFHGPGLVKKVHEDLLDRFDADGVERLDDIIGADRV